MKLFTKRIYSLLLVALFCLMGAVSVQAETYSQDFSSDGVFAPFKKSGDMVSVSGGKLCYTFSHKSISQTGFINRQEITLGSEFYISMNLTAKKASEFTGYVLFRDYYKEEGQLGFFNMVTFGKGKMTFPNNKYATIPTDADFLLEIAGSRESLEFYVDGALVQTMDMPSNFGYSHKQEFRLEFNNSNISSFTGSTITVDNLVVNSDASIDLNDEDISHWIQNFDDGNFNYFRLTGSDMSVSDGKLNFNFTRGESTKTSYFCLQNLALKEKFIFSAEFSVAKATDLNGTLLFRDYHSSETGTVGFYNMLVFSGGKINFLNGASKAIPTGTFRLKLVADKNSITTYLNEEAVNTSAVSNFGYTNLQEIRFELNDSGVPSGSSARISIDNLMVVNANLEPKHVVSDAVKYYVDYGRERIREEAYLDPYDSMNVSVILGNTTDETKSVSLLDAQGCQLVSDELLPGEVKQLVLPKASAPVSANDSFRFFLWDGTDTMQPVKLPSELLNDGVVIPKISDWKAMLSKDFGGTLWLSDEKVAQMKGYLNKNAATYDENFADYWADVLKEADATLRMGVQGFGTSFGVQSANRVYDRTALMSTVYKVTGDTKYADYARRQMLAAANFKHWNHEVSFLETAAVLSGLAIGYDCLKDVYLSDDDEKIIEKALYEKGILPGLAIYRTGVDTWDTRTTNWNVICNGGMGSAALAIGHLSVYRDDCAEVLNTALRNFRKVFHRYTSKGSWHEGPGYWGYMLKNSIDFQQMLLNAYGTNFGYEQFAPFMQTGYYAVAMNGAQNNFNYNDCPGDGILSSPRFFFFAEVFGDNALGAYHVEQLKTGTASFLDAIWYDTKFLQASTASLKPDFYDDELRIGSFRDNFIDNTYLAWSADDNLTPHSQNDMGNFVYDADGVRWFEDLGTDEYSLYEFLSYYTYKWYYYRNRAEGHNCMIFAPGKFDGSDYHTAPDQIYDAVGKIESVRYGQSDYSSAVMNLTDAYRNDCADYRRAVALDKTSKAMFVKDMMKFEKEIETYWFAHTKATIEVSSDGKSAVLTRTDNGQKKQLYVEILSGDGTFEVMNAVPLSTSPNPDELPENKKNNLKQNANAGYRKLFIHTTRPAGDNTLVVGAVPYENRSQLASARARVGF